MRHGFLLALIFKRFSCFGECSSECPPGWKWRRNGLCRGPCSWGVRGGWVVPKTPCFVGLEWFQGGSKGVGSFTCNVPWNNLTSIPIQIVCKLATRLFLCYDPPMSLMHWLLCFLLFPFLLVGAWWVGRNFPHRPPVDGRNLPRAPSRLPELLAPTVRWILVVAPTKPRTPHQMRLRVDLIDADVMAFEGGDRAMKFSLDSVEQAQRAPDGERRPRKPVTLKTDLGKEYGGRCP